MNLLDLLFPKRCVDCGALGKYICASCYKKIIPIAPNECICPMCEKLAIAGATHPRCQSKYSIDGLTSFFYYKDVVRRAIQSIKYQFVSDIVSELISYVPMQGYEIYGAKSQKNIALIPIPLHESRNKFRGFNQSELLGKKVAEILHITICTDVLHRTRETQAQVSMKKRNDRLRNMKHVFSVDSDALSHRLASPAGGRIDTCLLFDDVFTTGATMREAAVVLKRAGISFVWGVTIAR